MKKVITESQYSNTYGGLDLVEINGEHFLELDDCFGPTLWGPLTGEQLAAFDALLEVPMATDAEKTPPE